MTAAVLAGVRDALPEIGGLAVMVVLIAAWFWSERLIAVLARQCRRGGVR